MFRYFYNRHRFVTRFPILIIILLLLISVSSQVVADSDTLANQANGFIEGDLPDNFAITSSSIDNHRIETFSISMPQLEDREKDILVFLPSDYLINKNSYPVIYLQNAEEVFLYNGLGNKSWSLNEDLYQFYVSDLESEAIIVGIESDPIYFWEEYGPWVNENMYLWMDPYEANRVEGGKGDAYLDFLIQSLKPEIDRRYRTLPDRENTAIGGDKMGGLISLYAGLTRSDVFSKVMAMSPAVWFAENGGAWLSKNQLIELIDTAESPKAVSFFIDVAREERTTEIEVRPVVNDLHGMKISFPQAYLGGTRAIVKALIKKGLPISNVNGGVQNPDEWTEELFFSFIERDRATFTYFFPLFETPKFPPEFTSVAGTTFLIGHNNEFIIETTGGPAPTISYTGALPAGVNFIDNSDGTATLSGIPTGSDGIYTGTLSAKNGVTPSATQYFKLRITDQAVCEGDIGCIYSFDISMYHYLDRTRKIWVYLPPHYDPDGEGYQV
ncbi:MAG: alpha/beta hydrolase-fold protein, partial [Candidatus Helarchaeota archaeon]